MGDFSIWHWAVVGVIGLLVWGAIALSRWSRRAEKPGGIGGWLALLIVGLMFLGPVMGASRMSQDFFSAEAQYPNLPTIAAWVNYKTSAWLCFSATVLFSIYAGWCLLRRREPLSPRLAISALWIGGPVLSLLLTIFLPIVYFHDFNLAENDYPPLTATFTSAVLWTLYLVKSKRVKSLYMA